MRERAFEGRNVLVTGGLGFLGSNLARRLLEVGARVLVVDCLVPGYGGTPFNLHGVEDLLVIRRTDLRDAPSLPALVQGQEYLFNLAGQTSHLESMHDPHADLDMNCVAQLALLEACRKHNPTVKIVFTSTRQVYGPPDQLPVDERHRQRPVDVNGVNKLAAEWYHLLYNNVHGVRTCALRLTNTIGPRMRVKDGRQTFLGLWIRRLVEGQPFEVWEGHQLRDFTYVEDAVEALLLAAASDAANGQVYNLGGERALSLKELADLLLEVNGGGAYQLRDFPPDRKRIEIGHYYADYSLIQRVLGWRPRVPLREALSRTLAYYREHLAHYV
jgi:UDP-glucose 4-epimerase